MARAPVELAEVVEDGAANAELGIGLELHVARAVILLYGVEQPEDAGMDQVFKINVLRQSLMNLASDESDLRNLLEQRRLAQVSSRIRTVVFNQLHNLAVVTMVEKQVAGQSFWERCAELSAPFFVQNGGFRGKILREGLKFLGFPFGNAPCQGSQNGNRKDVRMASFSQTSHS